MDDESIIKILETPPGAGESIDDANARKEQVLGSLFGRLAIVESRGMWLRLSRERTGDGVSEAFARFPSARRQRLMSLLVDETRLQAVATRDRK